jgi:hypothetical protein
MSLSRTGLGTRVAAVQFIARNRYVDTMAVADQVRKNTPITETLAGADGLKKIPHSVGIFCL